MIEKWYHGIPFGHQQKLIRIIKLFDVCRCSNYLYAELFYSKIIQSEVTDKVLLVVLKLIEDSEYDKNLHIWQEAEESYS